MGSRYNDAAEPHADIGLNEIWSYEILSVGNQLTVTIRLGCSEGEVQGRADVDIALSGHNIGDDFMCFKAGGYNQNNTGDAGLANDFSQVVFYQLDASYD